MTQRSPFYNVFRGEGRCRKLSSIPGLYPQDASTIPCAPLVTTNNVPRHCPMSPGGTALLPVEWPWLGPVRGSQEEKETSVDPSELPPTD